MLTLQPLALPFISLVLSVLMATSAQARPSESHTEPSTNHFRQIEQPLPVKVGVTLGGVALIGLELWWFLFSKPKAKKAQR